MNRVFLSGSALSLLTAAILAGCGGGGSSSPSTSVTISNPPPPPVVSAAPTISSAPQAAVSESVSAPFYTLNAADPEGGPVTMALLPSPDSPAFAFNTLTGQLTAASTSGLDYELPLDSNEDNIYELTFRVSDEDGESSDFDVTINVDDVRDAFQFGLQTGVSPSENFDLLDWRLDFPLNSAGELTGLQDAPSERELDAGFSHPIYFRTGADGGMVMRAPVIGAKTSENARFTRTEFREMLRRGDTSISTNTNNTTERPNLNNWAFSSQPQDAQDEAGGVDGTLRVTMAVNAITTTGDNNEIGRTIIGQIHARNDEPIRLYYRKLPGNTHGSIYACHEIRDGNDITFDIIGSEDDDEPNPTNGFLLGEIFTYEIRAIGNTIEVDIIQDGQVVGSTSIDQSNSGYDIAADYMYFKAGNYHVNNTADPSEYAEVTIYELENSHIGYDF